MRLLILAAALASVPAAAQAQEDEAQVSEVFVFGDDPCPESSEEVITICGRLPEQDRYRIPEDLRYDPTDPESQSWYNRAIELSYLGRTGTGSCSVVGPGGFTGCHAELVRAARAERAAPPQNSWARIIAAARRERLEAIAAQAEAEEDAELTGGTRE